jgi:serine/threonine protein kinase
MGEALDDYAERLSRGERPSAEEYARRYPQLATVLRLTLPALEAARAPDPEATRSVRPETPGEPWPGPDGCLGDYRILRQVGRGGMGVVYEAEQISLRRRVALKVLPFAAALDTRHLQRFKLEAQAAALLHHTHIVPIYAVGSERGVHYYAMQFIDGQTVAAVIEERRRTQAAVPPGNRVPAPEARDGEAAAADTAPVAALTTQLPTRNTEFFRTAARLAVQAAEALEYAHRQGVLHRDVKPGNLLLDAEGNLWVTDFGLAQVRGDGRLTVTGDLVGTLRYMSPEQALAKRVAVDQRTDVYSLGVTLYELLTLRPAFAGTDREELLRQIAFEEPRPPRRLNRAIPVELETIVLRAMAKNPAERYTTAQELADDLKGFLEGKPIRARRSRPWERAYKWARRRPTAAALLAVSAVAVLALGALAAGLHYNRTLGDALATKAAALAQAEASHHEADQARQTAQQEHGRAEWYRYGYGVNLAWRGLLDGNMQQAEQLLADCPRDLRGWEWHFVKRVGRDALRELVEDDLRAHDRSTSRSVVFSPDGRLVAAAYAVLGPSGMLGEVKQRAVLWDADSGRRLATLPGKGTSGSLYLAFTPDGRRLIGVASDGTMQVWYVATGKEIRSLRVAQATPSYVTQCSFSADGGRVVLYGFDYRAGVWWATVLDVQAGREVRSFKAKGELPYAPAALSPDGKQLAWSGEGGTVQLLDADTGKPIPCLVLGSPNLGKTRAEKVD